MCVTLLGHWSPSIDFEELYKFFNSNKSLDIKDYLADFVALDKMSLVPLVIRRGCDLQKLGEVSEGVKAII